MAVSPLLVNLGIYMFAASVYASEGYLPSPYRVDHSTYFYGIPLGLLGIVAIFAYASPIFLIFNMVRKTQYSVHLFVRYILSVGIFFLLLSADYYGTSDWIID